jgi:hypothetical protein
MVIAVIASAEALQSSFPTKRSVQTLFLHMSTRDHPQSDGQTENANGILEDTLRHFVGPYQRDWDQRLSAVKFAMNNSYHSGIKSNWEEQVSKIKHVYAAAQQRYKQYADKLRRPFQNTFLETKSY